MNGGVVLDCTVRIKHPYRGHRYVLQNVVILQGVRVTLYMMEKLGLFMKEPAPKVDRHITTAFVDRHILLVVTLSLRSSK